MISSSMQQTLHSFNYDLPGIKYLSQHNDDINRVNRNKTGGGAYCLGYGDSSSYVGLNYSMKIQFNEFAVDLDRLHRHIRDDYHLGGKQIVNIFSFVVIFEKNICYKNLIQSERYSLLSPLENYFTYLVQHIKQGTQCTQSSTVAGGCYVSIEKQAALNNMAPYLHNFFTNSNHKHVKVRLKDGSFTTLYECIRNYFTTKTCYCGQVHNQVDSGSILYSATHMCPTLSKHITDYKNRHVIKLTGTTIIASISPSSHLILAT